MTTPTHAARESAWQKLNETTLVNDDTDVYRAMRWAFEQGYAAAQASHWRKIAEVLPETPNPWPVQVWIYVVYTVAETVHEFYQSGKFYKGEWMDDHGKLIESAFPGAKVIAWMPIPKFTPEPDEVKGE